jgi:hypothetical protein
VNLFGQTGNDFRQIRQFRGLGRLGHLTRRIGCRAVSYRVTHDTNSSSSLCEYVVPPSLMS